MSNLRDSSTLLRALKPTRIRVVFQAPEGKVEAPEGEHAPLSAPSYVPGSEAFRHAPLLASLTSGTTALIVVGRVQITAADAAGPEIVATVRALWAGMPDSNGGPRGWQAVSGDEKALIEVRQWLEGAIEVASVNSEPITVAKFGQRRKVVQHWGREHVVTEVSKAIAESSRNEVERARSLRYELEGRLSASIRDTSTGRLDIVLADLVELAVITSRARDEAREAAREGMSAWRSHEAAFHARRRLHDPSLVNRPVARTAHREPWFATYDAGVRQCESAERLLGEELHLLNGLLIAASSVATARDAQATASLTLVASVGAVALGIPAIIVGLYGAAEVLPLHIDARSVAVITPIAAASVLASVLAFIASKGTVSHRASRAGLTFAAALIMVALIALAGYLFPGT